VGLGAGLDVSKHRKTSPCLGRTIRSAVPVLTALSPKIALSHTVTYAAFLIASFHSILHNINIYYFFCLALQPSGLWPPRHKRFLDHTQRRATVGRTPLDE
jgi:hypothetical protein